jgi:predicted  nucleic acid-binding Zn-ribbon protein
MFLVGSLLFSGSGCTPIIVGGAAVGKVLSWLTFWKKDEEPEMFEEERMEKAFTSFATSIDGWYGEVRDDLLKNCKKSQKETEDYTYITAISGDGATFDAYDFLAIWIEKFWSEQRDYGYPPNETTTTTEITTTTNTNSTNTTVSPEEEEARNNLPWQLFLSIDAEKIKPFLLDTGEKGLLAPKSHYYYYYVVEEYKTVGGLILADKAEAEAKIKIRDGKKKELEGLEKEIGELEDSVSELIQDILTFEGELSALESQRDEILQQLSGYSGGSFPQTVQDKIDELREQLSQLNADISDKNSEISSKQNEIDEKTPDLSSKKSSIEPLKTEIANLKIIVSTKIVVLKNPNVIKELRVDPEGVEMNKEFLQEFMEKAKK